MSFDQQTGALVQMAEHMQTAVEQMKETRQLAAYLPDHEILRFIEESEHDGVSVIQAMHRGAAAATALSELLSEFRLYLARRQAAATGLKG